MKGGINARDSLRRCTRQGSNLMICDNTHDGTSPVCFNLDRGHGKCRPLSAESALASFRWRGIVLLLWSTKSVRESTAADYKKGYRV